MMTKYYAICTVSDELSELKKKIETDRRVTPVLLFNNMVVKIFRSKSHRFKELTSYSKFNTFIEFLGNVRVIYAMFSCAIK